MKIICLPKNNGEGGQEVHSSGSAAAHLLSTVAVVVVTVTVVAADAIDAVAVSVTTVFRQLTIRM